MATTYLQASDPYFQGAEGTVNRTSVAMTASDTVDTTPYPKNVIVTAPGNFSVLPLKNTDGTFLTFASLLVGYQFPFRIRRINATGTTGSAAGLYD